VSSAEEEIDQLYGLPLDEFTEARNTLARRFRDDGQRAIAARIKELKKPTLPAWTVNQLVRGREVDIPRLIRAGERLRHAHEQALAGDSPRGFEEARRDEQAALNRLSAGAHETLQASGHSAGALDRIISTLRAAASTEDGRRLLKEGRLTEELEPPGFDVLVGVPLQPQAKRPTVPQPGAAKTKRTTPKAAEKGEADTTAQRQRAEQSAERRRALSDARASVRQLRQQADQSRRRRQQAKREAERAERAAAEANSRVDEAEHELAAAESELAEAEARLAAIANAHQRP